MNDPEEPLATLVPKLREELGEAIAAVRTHRGDLTLQVRREAVAEVCAALREKHGFRYLVDLCGVDFPEREARFEVVYHLHAPEADRRLRLKVATGLATPVPSVSGVWPAARGYEREAWDLFGIRFEGHPELTRILLWEGFAGHPLRKDFPLEGSGDAEAAAGEGASEEIELGFGPRHPALQGVLRLRLRLEDERIAECRPVIGQLHRGLEKAFEARPFAANVAAMEGLDGVGATAGRLAYVGAVEKLLRISPPPRARFLRTAFAELDRIASHLFWLGAHAADLGFTDPAAAAFRERERILALELPAMIPGGLAGDLPAAAVERCRELLDGLPLRLDRIAGQLTGNRLWKKRTAGRGVLGPERAVGLGVTGPILRACGAGWDLRRALPYEAYGELGFTVPVGKNGDSYDRYQVRLEEIRQSAGIVAQCLDALPEGPVETGTRLPLVAPLRAEAYHAVEGPQGEIGVYLVGDGSPNPYRCHFRTPSFAHLQVLPELCRGELVSDLVTLIGTLDLDLGEADR